MSGPRVTRFLSRSTTTHSRLRSYKASAKLALLIPHRNGMGADKIGIIKCGNTGMYACDQRIGNNIERRISEQIVKTDNCVDVKRTCRSNAKQCHTVTIFATSKHSNS